MICRIDGYSPMHSTRVTSSSSFCVTPHTPGGSAGVRSDLLRSVHNRATQLHGSGLATSDTSPNRASPANSNTSPRGSQASVTSTGSSSSSRVSDAKDTTVPIELNQQVYIISSMCSVSRKKSPAEVFWHLLQKQLGLFSANFARLLQIPVYARLHIFIQLSPTVTKLCHIKCDHPACVSADGGHFEHMMWTSVVALNMA